MRAPTPGSQERRSSGNYRVFQYDDFCENLLVQDITWLPYLRLIRGKYILVDLDFFAGPQKHMNVFPRPLVPPLAFVRVFFFCFFFFPSLNISRIALTGDKVTPLQCFDLFQ